MQKRCAILNVEGELMDYLNAFWVGGLICALVQILLDRTKLLP